MKALFEILNKRKLIHDFLMGPVEASRIADCFSHDEQTSTAGRRVVRGGGGGGVDSDKSLPLSKILIFTSVSRPISPEGAACKLMTLRAKHFVDVSF